MFYSFFFHFQKGDSYRHIQTNILTNVITVILLLEYTNLHMYNVLLFLVKIYPKREGICPKTIPLLERECRVIENHPGLETVTFKWTEKSNVTKIQQPSFLHKLISFSNECGSQPHYVQSILQCKNAVTGCT